MTCAIMPPQDVANALREWSKNARCSSTFENAIYGQRSRTAQDQRHEAGEVQEVTLIAWWSKLRAGSSHGHQLDRTEPVGQMHGKNSHQQKRCHRQADQRHKGAQK